MPADDGQRIARVAFAVQDLSNNGTTKVEMMVERGHWSSEKESVEADQNYAMFLMGMIISGGEGERFGVAHPQEFTSKDALTTIYWNHRYAKGFFALKHRTQYTDVVERPVAIVGVGELPSRRGETIMWVQAVVDYLHIAGERFGLPLEEEALRNTQQPLRDLAYSRNPGPILERFRAKIGLL